MLERNDARRTVEDLQRVRGAQAATIMSQQADLVRLSLAKERTPE